MIKPLTLIIIVVSLFINTACGMAPVTPSPTPEATRPSPSATFPPTLTLPPTSTPVPPTMTATALPSATPLPSPTPTWAMAGPGTVEVPILLYHHILDYTGPEERYYVSPQAFKEQIAYLREQGYTAVTISQIALAITEGAPLPARPVAITFDDGNLNVYENAFPILREAGYPATMYLIANRLTSEGYLQKVQIAEMAAAGWEFGTHSLTHADLRSADLGLSTEMFQSKVTIEKTFNVPVSSIAYPFGAVDEMVLNRAVRYGFKSGAGLGVMNLHSIADLFYLSRREVFGDTSLDQFVRLLTVNGQ